MSRVLLVGTGPLPGPEQRQVGFPQLRTASFARALREAGHEVALACLRRHGDDAPPSAPSTWVSEIRDIPTEAHGWATAMVELRAAFQPDVVVSAGPYAPPRAAATAVRDEPLWVDVPGDPFAEAQAHAARRLHAGQGEEPLPPGSGAAQLAAHGAALARGDCFSACSGPQAHALLGQLGLLGRLSRSLPARRWVAVIPPAWDFGLPEGPPRRRAPGSPLCVALVGGFNTWLDEGGLLDGLLLAMGRGLPLEVVVVGGAIPGHFTEGWRRFSARVTASPFAEQFQLHGWLPQAALTQALEGAQLLLSLDHPGAEPALGSRTRLLFGLHQGLEVMATTAPELAADLAAEGFLHPLTPGPEALAEALAARVAEGSDGARVATAQRVLRERYDPVALAAPLLRWVASPDRAPAGAGPIEVLSERVTALEEELAAVHRSPTWRFLDAMNRHLGRLGRRS